MSVREDLIDQISFMLIRKGMNVDDFHDELYIILDDFEVQRRTTEIALPQEDRNEYLIKRFLVAKTVKGCTERTLEFYKNTLMFVLPRIGKTVDDIEPDDIRMYLAVRQKRDHVKKTTANNELRVLRTFFQYLTTEELIQKNPTLKIDRIKQNKTKKEAFTELEVEKIRECLITTREKAVVEVLLSTGCRVQELVSIKISDIKDDKLIVHGKGEKDRTVYLNAKAQVAIESYLTERRDNNPYLFCGGFSKALCVGTKGRYLREWYKYPENVNENEHIDKATIEELIRKIKKRSGIECSAYPHKFRRTCATFALKRGMPIEQVSKMLGHESIATTQIYLDLNDEDMHNAHKKYVV